MILIGHFSFPSSEKLVLSYGQLTSHGLRAKLSFTPNMGAGMRPQLGQSPLLDFCWV